MSERKTLTLKRKTLSLKPKKEPAPKEPKPVKPEKQPEPIEKSYPHDSEHLEKYLTETYQTWVDYLPLALGIVRPLIKELRDEKQLYDGMTIRRMLLHHTNKPQYLQNLIDMEHRYNLNGEAVGTITAKHKKGAEKRLKRLAKKAEKSN